MNTICILTFAHCLQCPGLPVGVVFCRQLIHLPVMKIEVTELFKGLDKMPNQFDIMAEFDKVIAQIKVPHIYSQLGSLGVY